MQEFRQRIARRLRHNNQLESLDEFEQVAEIKNALAFLGAQVTAREQAAEPAPGRTVARISEDGGRLVGKDEPRAEPVTRRPASGSSLKAVYSPAARCRRGGF